ncbi:MAG: bifunctional DNA-binding transcriptional regulator/O6-methylguanine-DNA methyltransferase Ada [Vicinamibacteraceae bacterium]
MVRQADQARPAYSSDEARWTAVLDRDGRADGQFFYSVDTTGIYCRPSCAARRPGRQHVRFHATADEAERAGYRPCRRCRPKGPSLGEQQADAVAKACGLMDTAEETPRLEALAAAVGMSRFHFHRVFKTLTGVTPRAYAAARRAERLRTELPRSPTVTDAIYSAGFNSSSRFYSASSAVLGMTPTRFRSGGQGAAIRFAVAECSLGSILVAATDKGICAIALADDPDGLVRELQDRFPNASLVGNDPGFDQLVAKVLGFVEAPATGLDLPLDIRGTAFQHRVWQALREIPAGQTMSYSEIGRRIGAPSAVRAVAHACASNAIAVAIPCHRVVRNDGTSSGYRWGVARKQQLLEREAAS